MVEANCRVSFRAAIKVLLLTACVGSSYWPMPIEHPPIVGVVEHLGWRGNTGTDRNPDRTDGGRIFANTTQDSATGNAGPGPFVG